MKKRYVSYLYVGDEHNTTMEIRSDHPEAHLIFTEMFTAIQKEFPKARVENHVFEQAELALLNYNEWLNGDGFANEGNPYAVLPENPFLE
jgi:hypothetical protein